MNVREDPLPTLFVPMTDVGAVTVAVRTAAAPLGLASAVREAAREFGSGLVLSDFRTQADQAAQTFAREHDFALIASLFGILALVLTSIGLYGLLSYGVARRTHEIGIRMALGARRGDVVRRVLRETMTLVGVGVIIGVAAALGIARVVQSLLFGVRPFDPIAMGVAVTLLVVIAIVAAALPARRAARVDPLIALRSE
jgi:ABC-type antimicrobial peptide transport system permease subunit